MNGNENLNRIRLRDKNAYVHINLDKIIMLVGDGNYTKFVFKDRGPLLCSKNIGEFESTLESIYFCRIHKSRIINMGNVKGYRKGTPGEVELVTGERIAIARRRKAEFLRLYKSYPLSSSSYIDSRGSMAS